MQYFLGGDIGSTKTHVLVADQYGAAIGFGEDGAGNHEVVGYEGFVQALSSACQAACQEAGLHLEDITAAGFGVSGYDWPSEKRATDAAMRAAGIRAPFLAVNDAILGLLAGSSEGWGLAVVSGTGCNCRGWDRQRQREGMVTGHGYIMGEGAGASELVHRAIQAVSHEWTLRGPATAISQALICAVGASSLADLIEGISQRYYDVDASAAPLIFAAANDGDAVAIDLIRWAGIELGELAKAVIRQLSFQDLEFEVVMVGSMFKGGRLLIDSMYDTIQSLAPKARLVPLTAPPVTGAVFLAMEQVNYTPAPEVRQNLVQSFQHYAKVGNEQAI
ncbi:MAG TPA: BadF/BadG/BcrA/BcrD ATPase family protein [Levilinea sp.]|nr:BadF/BadG/BcrA/BcrD ATPase family protein [Levilinea sp.]